MYQARETIISGNTVGAAFFSDGVRVAPMLPQFPYYVKCPECRAFFKINDAVARKKWSSLDSNIPYVRFLTIDEYKQAIKSGLYNGNKNDILKLRIALWQAFNGTKNGSEIDKKTFYEDNCRKILYGMGMIPHPMFDTIQRLLMSCGFKKLSMYISTLAPGNGMKLNTDEDLLMCAELWRNIGEFDKCKNLLKKIRLPDKFELYISTINAACDARNTFTVRLEIPGVAPFDSLEVTERHRTLTTTRPRTRFSESRLPNE